MVGYATSGRGWHKPAVAGDDPLYVDYHDSEWGLPSRDDRHLFEMLILEGAQAGLSWLTILRKRPNYLRAFDGFDPKAVAGYDDSKVAVSSPVKAYHLTGRCYDDAKAAETAPGRP